LFSMYYAMRRLPHLSDEEFHTYWRETHGPLAQRLLAGLGAKRYIQAHKIDDPLGEALRDARNAMEPFEGVAVISGDRDDLVKALGTTEGLQAVQEILDDEARFIDFSRSAIWLAEEHVILGQ
jgi:hypothetical protein